jgi:surface antigen
MSSLDHRQNSTTEQHGNTDPLQLSGMNAQQPLVEQLSFPEYPATAGIPLTPTPSDATASDPQMRALSPSPLVTRELTEVQTDAFSAVPFQRNTTTLRQPVIIRGTGRKSSSLRPPESRRKPATHAIVTVVLALVVLGALFFVMPVGTNGQSSLFKSIIGAPNGQMNIANVKGNDTALIAQQAATATVVTQDGYDPGAAVYAGVPTAPPSMSGSTGSTGSTGGAPVSTGGGLDRFFYGQCTYWANMRYYELTGHYVTWLGNADEWYAGALNAGWVVSSTPHIHSIIILQPYVQYAGSFGHVAVVEKILGNGVVETSDWNWEGNWGVTTYVNFTYPMSGVSFAWFPGAA